MQPDAEKQQRPIGQGNCDSRDRGRCAHKQVVRVAHSECHQQHRVQREGRAEAPRSEVLGVRRVREGARDGVQRRTGLAALEVVLRGVRRGSSVSILRPSSAAKLAILEGAEGDEKYGPLSRAKLTRVIANLGLAPAIGVTTGPAGAPLRTSCPAPACSAEKQTRRARPARTRPGRVPHRSARHPG